jgi:ribosomal-protein-alanine N-acetyltransferase
MMETTAIPVLTTERLVLRGWTDADKAPFAAMNADPRVMELFPSVLSTEDSDALIARTMAAFREEGFGLWAVERRRDRALLGFVGLAAPAWEAAFTPCVEIGWRLAFDAWGHGYATEAGRAVLEFAFERLRLGEVVSFTSGVNRRSRAVMERLGMSRDAADDFDHPRLPAGHPLRRHVLYRLSADRWRTVRAG